MFVYEQHGTTVRAAGGQFAYTVLPTDDGMYYLKIVPLRLTHF